MKLGTVEEIVAGCPDVERRMRQVYEDVLGSAS